MDKKKWALVIVVALMIGTGSYVFANPSLDSSEDTVPNHSVTKKNTGQENSGTQYNTTINQDSLTVDDIREMDIPQEEAEILEQIISSTGVLGNAEVTNNGETVAMPDVNNNILANVTESFVPENPNNGGNSSLNFGQDSTNNGSNTGNSSSSGSTGTSSGSGSSGSNQGSTNPNPGNTGGNQGNTDSGSSSSGNTSGSNTGNTTGDNEQTGGGTGSGSTDNQTPEEGDITYFTFTEDGEFSVNTIRINDPNYDHMIVYNWDTGLREETYETEHPIKVENGIYMFIVYYKDGTFKGFTMTHTKAE